MRPLGHVQYTPFILLSESKQNIPIEDHFILHLSPTRQLEK